MAKDVRGIKREDPENGKKFYDLNKDPIVSPYTGKSYPRSYFEQNTSRKAGAGRDEEQDEEEVEVEEVVVAAAPDEPEVISLEDADAEEAGEEEVIAEVEDVEDAEDIGDDDADAFLEEDEEEDENLDFDVNTSDER
ncbi:MAG: TIGR02300 family protein [Devosia sp.]